MATRFIQKLFAVGEQMESIKAVADELSVAMLMLSASGVQLDFLGSIQGVSRGGASDNDYRARIGRAISYNLSSGEMAKILECLADYLSDFDCTIDGTPGISSVVVANDASNAVWIREQEYATLEIHLQSSVTEGSRHTTPPYSDYHSIILPHERYSRVRQTVAAGVRFYIRNRFEEAHADEEFRWEPEADFHQINTITWDGSVATNHYTLANPEVLGQGIHGFCDCDEDGTPIPHSRYVEAYQ